MHGLKFSSMQENHWLPQSGFQPGDGGYYCQHLNDPEQHPHKLHKVDLYLPVKPL
ncbi:MAG: hypothetical protein OFPI_14940 [Osedax symbiont Rs2]|nr:MAG: hypothetical protein OFPI_14940 [Osedax symbiont Rs2]